MLQAFLAEVRQRKQRFPGQPGMHGRAWRGRPGEAATEAAGAPHRARLAAKSLLAVTDRINRQPPRLRRQHSV
eukprot:scaffold13765_cov64-Phaeocystis_antarctica.AAC.7